MPGKCRLHMLFGQRGVPCKREMSLNSWLLRYHIELIFCVERNDGTNMIEFMGFHFFNVWLLGCSIQEGAKGKLYRCNPEIKFGKDLASIPQQGFESCPLLEIFLVHALAIIYSNAPPLKICNKSTLRRLCDLIYEMSLEQINQLFVTISNYACALEARELLHCF